MIRRAADRMTTLGAVLHRGLQEHAAVLVTDDVDDPVAFTENDEIAAVRWVRPSEAAAEAGLDGVIATLTPRGRAVP